MDWITPNIAIGTCLEIVPRGCAVIDLRPTPDHCHIHAVVLDGAIDKIHKVVKNNGLVFVHCIGGVSRSPSIVAAYLALTEKISVDEAYARIKQARPSIQPHPDQIESVKE